MYEKNANKAKVKKNRFLTYKKVRQRTSNDINKKNMDTFFVPPPIVQQIDSNVVYFCFCIKVITSKLVVRLFMLQMLVVFFLLSLLLRIFFSQLV